MNLLGFNYGEGFVHLLEDVLLGVTICEQRYWAVLGMRIETID